MPSLAANKNLPLAFALVLGAAVVMEHGLRDFTAAFSGGATAQASSSVSGSGKNPLPGWTRGRIDQGVDFAGGRDILSPFDGTILKTGAPGWPGGGGVLIRSVDGQIWYFYEQLTALVKPGQKVKAGQKIGQGTGSIEVGLADAAGVPLSHAVYHEGMVTSAGRKAAALLSQLGAP